MYNGESLESQTLDRSSSISMAMKKQYSRAELTEIARLDPKRAKKIMTNRQSAMRCKQRKELYLSELEERAEVLKMETSRLSSRLAISRVGLF
ncbi:uncharacterized protein A4U43_C09F5790 [Asparagus officinalis]|uniref:BZIP domain-containing protein n=1 Tax=Asparagus officinalis TaxID=4686 RepID=A0A5P1E8V5_ASPOF|nr:uncharacterized protein A4U43_C09F5790 [Asparagus officinalis]